MRAHQEWRALDSGCLASVEVGMNDPEEIMHETTNGRNRDLLAHRVALEAAALAIEVAGDISAPLRSLADQVIRSASSVPANLAEGAGRT